MQTFVRVRTMGCSNGYGGMMPSKVVERRGNGFQPRPMKTEPKPAMVSDCQVVNDWCKQLIE